jgi:hypothetical protein
MACFLNFFVPRFALCSDFLHFITFQCHSASLPPNKQGSLALQLPHYLGEWAPVIVVPLMNNTVQTIVDYPSMD